MLAKRRCRYMSSSIPWISTSLISKNIFARISVTRAQALPIISNSEDYKVRVVAWMCWILVSYHQTSSTDNWLKILHHHKNWAFYKGDNLESRCPRCLSKLIQTINFLSWGIRKVRILRSRKMSRLAELTKMKMLAIFQTIFL